MRGTDLKVPKATETNIPVSGRTSVIFYYTIVDMPSNRDCDEFLSSRGMFMSMQEQHYVLCAKLENIPLQQVESSHTFSSGNFAESCMAQEH